MIEPNASTLFMGWDVGGWNCDRNPASRDALVVLDAERRLVGKPAAICGGRSTKPAPRSSLFMDS
jgi:hypothetical protein